MKKQDVELPVFTTKSGVKMTASKTKVFILEATDDDNYVVLEATYLGQLGPLLGPQMDAETALCHPKDF